VVWREWTRNLGAKILSFVVAGGVWLSVTNKIEFEKTLEFPIEYANRPAGLTSVEPLPQNVKVRVRGKGKFLRYTLREGFLQVDLSGYQIGQNQILYSGEDLILADDVEVSRADVVEPRRAVVEFDETVVRDVAITPSVVGAPDERYTQVGKTFLSPAMARVKGPRRLVDDITLLATREIDISEKRSTVRKRVRLRPPPSPTIEVTPMTVDVGITIEPLLVQRIDAVHLVVQSGGKPVGNISFRPALVAVEIEGARSIVEVAVKEMSSLFLHAEEWPIGTGQLSFESLRGRDVLFTLESPFPALPDTTLVGGTGDGPPDSAGTVPTRQITGQLPLPRDVSVLSLVPQRFLVTVTDPARPPAPAPDRGS
jgi:hypothetical protein